MRWYRRRGGSTSGRRVAVLPTRTSPQCNEVAESTIEDVLGIPIVEDDGFKGGDDEEFDIEDIIELGSSLLLNILSDKPLELGNQAETAKESPSTLQGTVDDMSQWVPLA